MEGIANNTYYVSLKNMMHTYLRHDQFKET